MARPGAILPGAPARATGLLSTAAREDLVMGYLFILPALVILGLFLFWPIIQTFGMSFFAWDLLTQERRFTGLTNYRLILDSDDFHLALRNTLYYVLGVVPLQTVTALLLALAANQPIRGRTFFRAAFYFPSISSSVVVSLLFLLILQGGGLLDWLVAVVGGTPPRPPWLSNPNGLLQLLAEPFGWRPPWWAVGPSIALVSIMALNVWTTTGTLMVVFLAGLQSITRDVYEAAAVDGATGWQAFRHVTLPLLRPVTLFVITVGLIGTFQVFDQVWIMTKGQDQTTTLVYLIYTESFGGGFRAGSAAALAVILFVIIFVVTLVQRRLYAGDEES